jgi:hypothetical protein
MIRSSRSPSKQRARTSRRISASGPAQHGTANVSFSLQPRPFAGGPRGRAAATSIGTCPAYWRARPCESCRPRAALRRMPMRRTANERTKNGTGRQYVPRQADVLGRLFGKRTGRKDCLRQVTKLWSGIWETRFPQQGPLRSQPPRHIRYIFPARGDLVSANLHLTEVDACMTTLLWELVLLAACLQIA